MGTATTCPRADWAGTRDPWGSDISWERLEGLTIAVVRFFSMSLEGGSTADCGRRTAECVLATRLQCVLRHLNALPARSLAGDAPVMRTSAGFGGSPLPKR